jgi:hypothetical protein
VEPPGSALVVDEAVAAVGIEEFDETLHGFAARGKRAGGNNRITAKRASAH